MRNSIVAVIGVIIVGLGVWGILAWRTSVATNAQSDICHVLYRIIAASDASLGRPGTPGAFYYHKHPGELAAAHRANQKTLGELPCKGP